MLTHEGMERGAPGGSSRLAYPSPAWVILSAPNGSDSNPGTSDRPWATPGDTLIILCGRYTLSEYEADVITLPSGTAWVTIRGEEGNRPVLVGRDNLLTAINLSGIQNLEIAHDDTASGQAAWFREGVEILGAPAAHIVLPCYP